MIQRLKKIFKLVTVVLIVAIVLIGASFIPTLRLQNGKMSELSGNWITVYYEAEATAAKDVFNLAEEKSRHLAEKLGFSDKQEIKIYIYDEQSTFQTKKYGLIGPLLGLDWYIGDNRGTNVLLTSPAHPGAVHSYKDVKEASLHEMVHAYNSIVNSKMPLWLNEGVASYLTNGNPPDNLYYCYNTGIPTLKQMQTNSPIEFSKIGGYDFAYTYIEYLDVTYGWEKVLTLLKTVDYEKTLGTSAQGIYEEWVKFLGKNYNG